MYGRYLNTLLKNNKNQEAVNMLTELLDTLKVLGLFIEEPINVIDRLTEKYLLMNNISKEEINKKLDERKKYRDEKDYQSSDKIRNELLEKNIKVSDVNGSQEWIINI